MDFRKVEVSALAWRSGPKGAVATLRGSRVVVQVPVARYAVFPDSRNPAWRDLVVFLDADDPAHAAFSDFVSRVLSAAAASTGLDPADAAPSGASLREKLFGGEPAFDEAGAPLADLPDRGRAAVLLELGGTWTSAAGGRWGLRWKLKQLRLAAGGSAPAAAAAPARGAFAFV